MPTEGLTGRERPVLWRLVGVFELSSRHQNYTWAIRGQKPIRPEGGGVVPGVGASLFIGVIGRSSAAA